MRIGIYGGTFDPIHIAHMIIAERAREQLQLDKLFFIPTFIPPHKKTKTVSDAQDRIDMVKCAIQSEKHFYLSDYEITRKETSYTVYTLQHFRDTMGLEREQLFLLIGADNFVDFHTWKDPEEIVKLCRLCIVDRPNLSGKDVEQPIKTDAIWIDAPLMGISSSDIRDKVRNGKSIHYLVPPGVEDYIISYNLYQHS